MFCLSHLTNGVKRKEILYLLTSRGILINLLFFKVFWKRHFSLLSHLKQRKVHDLIIIDPGSSLILARPVIVLPLVRHFSRLHSQQTIFVIMLL